MFAVDDIDDVVARLRAHGAELVGEVEQYEDSYRPATSAAPRHHWCVRLSTTGARKPARRKRATARLSLKGHGR